MNKQIIVFILSILAAGISGSAPAAPSYQLLDPNAYQSFIANWTPATEPLCAAIQSQADWDIVFRPAPVIGANRPFAPPAEF